jgi:hypothetical protein
MHHELRSVAGLDREVGAMPNSSYETVGDQSEDTIKRQGQGQLLWVPESLQKLVA